MCFRARFISASAVLQQSARTENCISIPKTFLRMAKEYIPSTRSWSDYPASVVRALEAFGYPLPQGADFVFNGDLPDGAGLSSSAAMEVATGVTLRELFGIPVTQQELALLGQFAENRFIGVNCGIMDQFASAMGRKKTRFCSMRTHFPINTRRSSMRLWSLSTVGCGIL